MAEVSDKLVTNLKVSEKELDAGETTLKTRSVANVLSTRSLLGLLDRPPEIRMMIFRHLLVYPYYLANRLWPIGPRPSVAILRTNKLIHREAFEVLYGENTFFKRFWSSYCFQNWFPRVSDTMQNIHMEIAMCRKSSDIQKFLTLIHYFDPSIIRDTLVVEFLTEFSLVGPLKWFIRALGRFTNFRTILIEVRLYDPFCYHRNIFHLREYLKTALEPLLGYAQGCTILRFHPLDHRNFWREDGDWADSLDGIRLNWKENDMDAATDA